MRINLSPVQKLLLYCARSPQREHDEEAAKEIKSIIKNKIRWENFISRAKFLGIAPNCYLHLKQFKDEVPSHIQERLQELFAKNAAQNTRLWSSLKEILRSFNQAQIDAIPLKGPYLSEALYANIGLRSSSDIDLLIRKQDFGRAKDVLATLGYAPVRLIPYTEKFSLDYRRHEQFIASDPSKHMPLIELHWNFYITSPREYDMTSVWKYDIPEKIDDVSFLSLPPTLTLLHLAINLRLHGFLNLKQLADLDALVARAKSEAGIEMIHDIRTEKKQEAKHDIKSEMKRDTKFKTKHETKYAISWDYAAKQAQLNRQRVGLFYALSFARELLGTEVPAAILDHIKPGWLQDKLVRSIIKPWRILSSDKDSVPKIYWDVVRIATSDSLMDAIRIIWSTALSHPEDLMARYGLGIRSLSSSSFLSRLLQPLYLLREACKILFGFMKRKKKE